ncbi:MAG: CDP-alcohol phosphatidyltransferase family protein, partial [Candidatus Eisenbacteria bacterium]
MNPPLEARSQVLHSARGATPFPRGCRARLMGLASGMPAPHGCAGTQSRAGARGRRVAARNFCDARPGTRRTYTRGPRPRRPWEPPSRGLEGRPAALTLRRFNPGSRMFVEEYLQDLRRDRFAPRAFARYFRRVAARARDAMVANPGAVRSVWTVGLVFFAAAFLAAMQIALHYDRHLAYDFFLQTSLWILPAFAFVSLNIEHLRDRDGYPLSALNLPTVLTLLRVVLVPGIALFLLDRHFALALVTFLLAALSDVADGWLARRWKQETKLGTALDPVVDVVFNLALFFALMAAHLMPAWVFAVAALRYGILLVGGAG